MAMNIFLLARILDCMTENVSGEMSETECVREWELSICPELGVASWEKEEWESEQSKA